jgi:hypothetical protein
LSSVFFLWKTISMATFPWKFLLAGYVPCSVTADAMRAKCTPGIFPYCILCYTVGDIVVKQKFSCKMAMAIVFQRKKQNWNRGKVVGVLSILAMVNNGPYTVL